MMDDSSAEAVLARVNGAPLIELPNDLYIPPDALEVILESFEGPLDLLLYLIRRQNLSILDIPIAEITRQYIAYIDMMAVLRIELAAEYLLMAAILAEIKSRLLLPKPAAAAEAEEADPRADLIRRLREYERYKLAAQELDQLPRCERDVHQAVADASAIQVVKTPPEVDLREVLLAFQDVLRRAERLTSHQITREALSVRERMTAILERLQHQALMPFQELFEHTEGRPGVVVALLAILELSKERLIEILQDHPLGPLHIRPAANS